MEVVSYLPHHTSPVTAAFPSQTDKTDVVSPAAALKTLSPMTSLKWGKIEFQSKNSGDAGLASNSYSARCYTRTKSTPNLLAAVIWLTDGIAC